MHITPQRGLYHEKDSSMRSPDWQVIEAQAKQELEQITPDQDAIAFIEKYFGKDMQPKYLKRYRSNRHEQSSPVGAYWCWSTWYNCQRKRKEKGQPP